MSMPLNHSIWYAWTAPDYGTFSFNTGGATYAWVFTGDALGALDLKINGQAYGFVSVRPGVTYRIALDDWLPGAPTQLSWSFEQSPPPPPNDDWANAQPLEGTGGTVALDTLGSTREACDTAYGFQQPGLIVRFPKHGFQALRQTALPRQLSPGGKAFQKLCDLLPDGPGEKSRTQHHAKPPGTAAGGW